MVLTEEQEIALAGHCTQILFNKEYPETHEVAMLRLLVHVSALAAVHT